MVFGAASPKLVGRDTLPTGSWSVIRSTKIPSVKDKVRYYPKTKKTNEALENHEDL